MRFTSSTEVKGKAGANVRRTLTVAYYISAKGLVEVSGVGRLAVKAALADISAPAEISAEGHSGGWYCCHFSGMDVGGSQWGPIRNDPGPPATISALRTQYRQYPTTLPGILGMLFTSNPLLYRGEQSVMVRVLYLRKIPSGGI